MAKDKKEKTYSSEEVYVIRIAKGKTVEVGQKGNIKCEEGQFCYYRLAFVLREKGNCTLYRIWNPQYKDHGVIISTQPTTSKGMYKGNSFVSDAMTLKEAIPMLSRGIREDESIEDFSQLTENFLKLINYDVAFNVIDGSFFSKSEIGQEFYNAENLGQEGFLS